MPIQISDDELPALIAALVQGKFRPSSPDEAVAASPIVARIARRVCAAERERQVIRFGDSQIVHLNRWDDFSEHGAEWDVAVAHARKFFAPQWASWSAERRGQVVDDLISPFSLSSDARKVFITAFLSPA
jgi:hypothetical protein